MSITGVWYHCTFSFIYYKNKRRLESQRSEYDCKPTFIRVLDNFERFVTASSLLTLIFTVNEFITSNSRNKVFAINVTEPVHLLYMFISRRPSALPFLWLYPIFWKVSGVLRIKWKFNFTGKSRFNLLLHKKKSILFHNFNSFFGCSSFIFWCFNLIYRK